MKAVTSLMLIPALFGSTQDSEKIQKYNHHFYSHQAIHITPCIFEMELVPKWSMASRIKKKKNGKNIYSGKATRVAMGEVPRLYPANQLDYIMSPSAGNLITADSQTLQLEMTHNQRPWFEHTLKYAEPNDIMKQLPDTVIAIWR